MADLYIENDEIKVGINYHGAELVSLINKKTGREYMWCGDAKYWGRVSPVLFPFIGKLKNTSFTHEGKVYEGVPQHGYARDCDFILNENDGTSAWFELLLDDTWKERYPYIFQLKIGYKLEGKAVHVMWSVTNTDDKTIHFSIGAHPAFACENGLADYKIDLHVNANCLKTQVLTQNGIVNDELKDVAVDNGVLTLSDELFDGDALILDSKDIHTATLSTAAGEKMVEVRFDTPLVGIWSPVGKKAPFVCIEPWYGRCDSENFTGTLKDREYGNSLEVGHSFNKEYVMEIF